MITEDNFNKLEGNMFWNMIITSNVSEFRNHLSFLLQPRLEAIIITTQRMPKATLKMEEREYSILLTAKIRIATDNDISNDNAMFRTFLKQILSDGLVQIRISNNLLSKICCKIIADIKLSKSYQTLVQLVLSNLL